MRKYRTRLVMGVIAIILVACARGQPIYNVSNHPLPDTVRSWPLPRIGQVIAFAASDRGWRVEPGQQPGSLRANYDNRKHQAAINITYTQQSFSVALASSGGLRQTDATIHRTYNRWIQNLEQAIDRRMATASLGQELKSEKEKEESD